MSSSGWLYHYIRGNYKWPRAGDGEPIRSQIGCQPKTNCLLALTEGFYLHNSNPKPNRSALAAPIAQLCTAAPSRRPRPTARRGTWPRTARPNRGRPTGPRRRVRRGGRRPVAGSLAQRLGREEGKAARQPF